MKDIVIGTSGRERGLRFVRAAFPFGRRATAAAIVVLCSSCFWCTLRGIGPFAILSHQESLLLLQAFMAISGLLAVAMSASCSKHRKLEAELRRLAATDPLTGLGNYGRFVDALRVEIKRSERSGQPFAILFVDIDDLKLLNDRQGHTVGNQALCKVANVIRSCCRSIDTVARFGGDEFTLILPDAEEEAALRVAERIAKQLVSRADGPFVTVSIGVAVYPRHGESIEALLSAADSVLYQAKTLSHQITSGSASIAHLAAAMFERNVYGDVLNDLERAPEQQH
jgi:diguanylate cyclase (GGDEF)-like protein